MDEQGNDLSAEMRTIGRMSLGMKLRILRGRKGKTLAEVSRGMGISVSCLSDVERNQALLALSMCQRLADYYGVTLAEMFKDVRIDVKEEE